MVQQATKKPITIEFMQFNGLNNTDIGVWVGQPLKMELESETAYLASVAPPIFSLTIPTLEGDMKAMPGDYIIKGIKGEFYPCKPDIFEGSYKVNEKPKDRSEYDYSISTKHSSVCLSRAGDDEPIFVLRAKDPTAPVVIEKWIEENETSMIQPDKKLQGARKVIESMKEWFLANVSIEHRSAK